MDAAAPALVFVRAPTSRKRDVSIDEASVVKPKQLDGAISLVSCRVGALVVAVME